MAGRGRQDALSTDPGRTLSYQNHPGKSVGDAGSAGILSALSAPRESLVFVQSRSGGDRRLDPFTIYNPRFTDFNSRLLHKLESHAIHAVTQPCRFWSIIENVSGVGIAPRAQHFGTSHS